MTRTKGGKSVVRYFAAFLAVMISQGSAQALDRCTGGNRAERRVTCVVDGDTLWEQGIKMRMLDIDAPEMRGSCPAEAMRARQSADRLISLMSSGYEIENSGKKDKTSDRRALVRVRLFDGRDAGDVLVNEGLAQRWPNRGNVWCDIMPD